ncbi:hypothetical protein NPIL_589431 [Nephila pilipes]|uniref:Uncharacterized protein n=1 Tax=Nephila pilipes TaxID=299642 RepID=A0A8X6PBS5_NEPPI|nr:hypothetical protein NPIL_589431 [Nephila pilipes]
MQPQSDCSNLRSPLLLLFMEVSGRGGRDSIRQCEYTSEKERVPSALNRITDKNWLREDRVNSEMVRDRCLSKMKEGYFYLPHSTFFLRKRILTRLLASNIARVPDK